MDEVDVAARNEEVLLAARISEAQAAAKRSMKPTGRCYYCGEILEDQHALFCDSYCRQDYTREQEIRRKNGTK